MELRAGQFPHVPGKTEGNVVGVHHTLIMKRWGFFSFQTCRANSASKAFFKGVYSKYRNTRWSGKDWFESYISRWIKGYVLVKVRSPPS